MRKSLQWPIFTAAFVAYLLALTQYLQEHDIRRINSDLLYMPALFRDVTEWGGRFSEWRLTPAPYLFPDMALYFPLATLTGSWYGGFISQAIIQFLLFTAGWCLLGYFLFTHKETRITFATLTLVTTTYLLTLTPQNQHIIAPQFHLTIHFGVMLCLPYLLCFCFLHL